MRGKIVAADGDRATTRLLEVVLEQAGYEVVATSDGSEAVAAIDAQPPDAILLGSSLPNVDSFEILTRVKRSPGTRAIPVIVLISSHVGDGVFQAWRAGVDAYVSKPFSPAELIGVVDRVLSGSPGDGPRPAGGAMHGNLWADVV